jgi:hypothetical protein
MSLHALDDIGDALDATKSLLLPVDPPQWLRLALVVFFIGGGGGGFNMLRGVSGTTDLAAENGDGGSAGSTEPVLQMSDPGIPPEELFTDSVVIAAIVAIGVFVLMTALLSNFMEFVFTQALIEREIHVRQYFTDNIGNGLRLFVFRAGIDLLSLLSLALVGLVAVVIVRGGDAANISPEALLALLPVGIVVFAVGIVVVGIITGFTNVFVVPLVVQGESGIIGGWRRLLSSISDQPKQYLGYLVLSVVLGVGVGIVGSIVGMIAFIALAIPFGILGAGIVFGLGHSGVGLILGVSIAALFVVCLLLVTTLIKVPVQSFLRYYAMLVLGDIDESLDPIPDVRSDIRSTGE